MELLMGLLTKTLNMSEDDIKSVIIKEGSEDELKDDALTLLLAKDAERISLIKEKSKGDSDSQYKRGQRETAEKFENSIKTTFGIEDDLNGNDLIAKAKELNTGGSGDGKLTDDDVKAHPVFIALQTEKSKEIAQMQKDHKSALDNNENEFNAKMTRSSVNQKALAHIRSKNPVLPEDTKKADKRLNTILPELANYKFEQNGNDIIVKDLDGKLLTDAHDNAVSFDQLVDGIAEDYFDFDSGGDGGSKGTGNGGDNFGKGKFNTVKIPQSPQELQKAMEGAKSSEERQKISEAYLEAQKKDD